MFYLRVGVGRQDREVGLIKLLFFAGPVLLRLGSSPKVTTQVRAQILSLNKYPLCHATLVYSCTPESLPKYLPHYMEYQPSYVHTAYHSYQYM